MSERLRLYAEDTDDLQVISACLQDALTRLAEMAYQPARRRFALVLSRFMWEASEREPRRRDGRRIRAGLHFDNVLLVRARNIDQSNREGLLSLLTIAAEARGGRVLVTLQFSGGGSVQLETECIDCQLMDMGEPWPTPRRPAHAVGAGA